MNITEIVFTLIAALSLFAFIVTTLSIRKTKLDNKNDERYQIIVSNSTEIAYAAFGVLVTGFALILAVLTPLGINLELEYIPALFLLINALVELLRLSLIKKYENKM